MHEEEVEVRCIFEKRNVLTGKPSNDCWALMRKACNGCVFYKGSDEWLRDKHGYAIRRGE